MDLSSLQYNSENPTLISCVFTVTCSLILGILIAFTYDKTSREINRPNHFIQAMVLITIVAATIIQAIGDSVARGLGMLGALSIIRFRTTVRDPRNVVFMFGAIAAGIACGVFGFVIAIVGTLCFCLSAFLLYYSSFSPSKSLVGHLKIELPRDYAQFPEIEKQLDNFCKRYVLKSYKVFTNSKKRSLYLYEYRIKLHNSYQGGELMEALLNFPEVKVLGLSFGSTDKDEI